MKLGIKVIPPGSTVYLHVDIKAVVTCVSIRADRICYEVAWMDGRQRQEAYVEEFEITPCDGEELPIGFVNTTMANKIRDRERRVV